MRSGDVFRFVGVSDIHVWMIISNPLRDSAKVLLVNFSTWEPHLDQACLIQPGEHPFIVHQSVINFARAKVASDANLELLKAKGRLKLLEPLSDALLAKIRDSAMLSTTLRLDYADILLDQELVD